MHLQLLCSYITITSYNIFKCISTRREPKWFVWLVVIKNHSLSNKKLKNINENVITFKECKKKISNRLWIIILFKKTWAIFRTTKLLFKILESTTNFYKNILKWFIIGEIHKIVYFFIYLLSKTIKNLI